MSELPLIIAGPMLRHTTNTQLTLWVVTTKYLHANVQIAKYQSNTLLEVPLNNSNRQCIQVGKHCYINLINIQTDTAFPTDTLLTYDLVVQEETSTLTLNTLAPTLCYEGHTKPVFCIKPNIQQMMHGSCRKPHHAQTDGLLIVDEKIHKTLTEPDKKPSLLMFTGDQIYADDVAGPLLAAIHQTISVLGLFNESWTGSKINNQHELTNSVECYYQRDQLLPHNESNQNLLELFFRGARKPIFTSVGKHNHLISLSEVIAMYLLVWSDTPWQWIDWQLIKPPTTTQFVPRFNQELAIIKEFADGTGRVRRALAHIPCYMIFDDHDVTDDWNLTRGWEEAAYENSFSRRIIGNALVGYWLCQGWGNYPSNYSKLHQSVQTFFTENGVSDHDQLVNILLSWEHWHYHLDTQPKLIVLDTRTHRWRSESSAAKPSGLMDWETLSELQQELINQPAVIMVSPAPIFGVKLIEAIQRVFTFFGKALMVDAENWMAHPGTANVILNIFRHPKTPPQFIILSGDVHYSFCYDVSLRFRRQTPHILQVTASGIKNAFPDKLLRNIDTMNRVLYASLSPLNWFTKRRGMLVKKRHPTHHQPASLYNHSGVGEIILADKIENVVVKVHSSNGDDVEFK